MISMDFVIGVPKVGNKSIIMMVVDQLSKYDVPYNTFTPTNVSQVSLNYIFKLHGMPTSIMTPHSPKKFARYV